MMPQKVKAYLNNNYAILILWLIFTCAPLWNFFFLSGLCKVIPVRLTIEHAYNTLYLELIFAMVLVFFIKISLFKKMMLFIFTPALCFVAWVVIVLISMAAYGVH